MTAIREAANSLSQCSSLQSFMFIPTITNIDAVEDRAWSGFRCFLSHLPRTIQQITVQFYSYSHAAILMALDVLRESDWEQVEQILIGFYDLDFIKFGFTLAEEVGRGEASSMAALDRQLEKVVEDKIAAVEARGILRFGSVFDSEEWGTSRGVE